MKKETIGTIINLLEQATAFHTLPLIDQIIAEYRKDPYLILISCLLSLRVKDSTTIHVCRELFKHAQTPEEMCMLSRPFLEKIIFKTGFYKNKAKVLHQVSADILQRFNGVVPTTLHDLLSLKGVGIKTAHLVLGLAYGVPAICVDTHVHRISNRLGLITTKTVEQTEEALRRLLPQDYWITWNKLLVMWGQNVCVPISPKCSVCPLVSLCKRVGVTKSR
jgi:endonuclease-3